MTLAIVRAKGTSAVRPRETEETANTIKTTKKTAAVSKKAATKKSAYKLLIVESPAKAKTIAKYLGRGYRVEASNGHVRDLPRSQMGVDVERNFEPKYITIRGRGDVLSRIRKEAKGAERVLLATDPDREGEAISWHLANILGVDPADNCRVTFQEITKKAVKSQVITPRPIDMSLVDAQQARRVLDRLVGYSISPLLWAKVQKGLSGGRVQSVATRIVVDREDEIDAFVSEEYWDINARVSVGSQSIKTRLDTLGGVKATLDNAEKSQAAEEAIKAAVLSVKSVKPGEKKKHPSAPFTTSNMQQEASRKLRFTPSKTMMIAQTLYEGVDVAGEGATGLITYMRTDSVRVSDEAIEAVRSEITSRFGAEYLPETPNQYKGRARSQDAHEAIRPTDVTRKPDYIKESLTKDQYNLYKLVYNRFLASQMTSAMFDTMTVIIESADKTVGLRFYGENKRFAGFSAVYEEGTDEAAPDVETKLPKLTVGQSVSVESISRDQHFTQPPPRYTEASLVRALEEKGIGRPSTYAPTISTIVARGYIVKDKSRLIPTELGRMVTNMMCRYFTDIVDVAFTSEMESQLDKVEEEHLPWREVIAVFYDNFSKVLKVAENEIEKIPQVEEVSDIPCEHCGSMMVYKNGRFGRFLACPKFPECRNTKPVFVYIDTPCPNCGARLVQKISRKGGKFYSCEKYPECEFIAFEYPVTDRCAECGSPMVLKENRKGQRFHVCMNEKCRKRVEIESAEQNETVESEGVDAAGAES
ncbi:DNA topoisomerase I [Clostridia bacterium]|nr:DNA topoisomerase I [Clostridia bacterium]